jgi:hypothetical protein
MLGSGVSSRNIAASRSSSFGGLGEIKRDRRRENMLISG